MSEKRIEQNADACMGYNPRPLTSARPHIKVDKDPSGGNQPRRDPGFGGSCLLGENSCVSGCCVSAIVRNREDVEEVEDTHCVFLMKEKRSLKTLGCESVREERTQMANERPSERLSTISGRSARKELSRLYYRIRYASDSRDPLQKFNKARRSFSASSCSEEKQK
jgi:hypothetical protein